MIYPLPTSFSDELGELFRRGHTNQTPLSFLEKIGKAQSNVSYVTLYLMNCCCSNHTNALFVVDSRRKVSSTMSVHLGLVVSDLLSLAAEYVLKQEAP